jgi:hypothetical protein
LPQNKQKINTIRPEEAAIALDNLWGKKKSRTHQMRLSYLKYGDCE